MSIETNHAHEKVKEQSMEKYFYNSYFSFEKYNSKQPSAFVK